MKVFIPGFNSRQANKRARLFPMLMLTSLALCILPSSARGGGQESTDGRKSDTVTALKASSKTSAKMVSPARKKAPQVLITGSLIPREISRANGALDTASVVYVINGDQIRRSGASSVSGVLRSYGMGR